MEINESSDVEFVSLLDESVRVQFADVQLMRTQCTETARRLMNETPGTPAYEELRLDLVAMLAGEKRASAACKEILGRLARSQAAHG